MKKSAKIIIPLAILAAGALLMMGMLSLRSKPPKSAPASRAKVVEARLAQPGTVTARISAYGRVTSAQPIQLISEVSGILETGDISFRPGQSFKEGDLLVKVDDRQAELKLNATKSDLLNALATVLPEIKVDFPDEFPTWQNYFESCRFGTKLGPLPEAANSRIKLFLSRFNVYKLYFSARDLEITLEKHRFYAPFDGALVTTNLNIGATARNGTLLGEIINLSDLEVEIPMPVEDAEWVEFGGRVVLTSAERKGQWTGTIRRIGSTVDERTQAVPLYVAIDNAAASGLISGVFLQATLPGKDIPGAVVVPRKALYQDNYVYLVNNGRFEYREISIALRQDHTVIVDGGLATGDTLVVQALQGVAPGMPAIARIGTESSGSDR